MSSADTTANGSGDDGNSSDKDSPAFRLRPRRSTPRPTPSASNSSQAKRYSLLSNKESPLYEARIAAKLKYKAVSPAKRKLFRFSSFEEREESLKRSIPPLSPSRSVVEEINIGVFAERVLVKRLESGKSYDSNYISVETVLIAETDNKDTSDESFLKLIVRDAVEGNEVISDKEKVLIVYLYGHYSNLPHISIGKYLEIFKFKTVAIDDESEPSTFSINGCDIERLPYFAIVKAVKNHNWVPFVSIKSTFKPLIDHSALAVSNQKTFISNSPTPKEEENSSKTERPESPEDLEPKKTYSKVSVNIAIVEVLARGRLICKFLKDDSDKFVIVLLDNRINVRCDMQLTLTNFKTSLLPENYTVKGSARNYDNFYPFTLSVFEATKLNGSKAREGQREIAPNTTTAITNTITHATTTTTIIQAPISNMKSTNDASMKYSYLSLKEVKISACSKRTYCHIYGILVRHDFDRNIITLSDESCDEFQVRLKGDEEGARYPPFKTGDIIRIHRLISSPVSDLSICFHPRNMLVFSAFKAKEKIRPTNNDFTMESYDHERVKELDEWYARKILKVSLSDLPHHGYVNIAGRIMTTFTKDSSLALITVTDGTKPSLDSLKDFPKDFGLFTSAYDFRFNETTKKQLLVFVTLFDCHAMKVTKLRQGTLVIIFNAKIDKNGILLHGNKHYGKCIRVIHMESVFGKLLRSKIECNMDQDIINFLASNDDPDDEVQSDAPIDRSAETENVLEYQQQNASSTESQIYKDINAMPDFDGNTCLIAAKAANYYPGFLQMSDLIIALCDACKKIFNVQNIVDKKCPHCAHDIIFQFLIVFVLLDRKNTKLIATLEAKAAETFFGIPATQALDSTAMWNTIVESICKLCSVANNTDSDFENLKNPLLLWKIKQEQSFYKILEVKQYNLGDEINPVTKSVAVGCNLSFLK
ncbi:Protection of telomeres protein 1-like protein [Dinothrombium tinctorium]|uniref:Protection of telomeres protein 1-like protein n=1 Tax=Dinothrombium tinctorium TaxID=1965070 RepID=A0A3S3P0D4_9ACAR|nr:Protection of telomeres protein 1-like protein [Dinothrombium tinctorium]